MLAWVRYSRGSHFDYVLKVVWCLEGDTVIRTLDTTRACCLCLLNLVQLSQPFNGLNGRMPFAANQTG